MGNDKPRFGKTVFDMDVQAINDCDIVVALNYGLYSDSDTAWECGYAYGIGKKVINIIIRQQEEYNLMMINGAKETKNIDDLLFDVDTITNILQR